tara:strand:+ start:1974 stop:2426 length:453 start_codon:yes stop_codon:yes gene_type:complete
MTEFSKCNKGNNMKTFQCILILFASLTTFSQNTVPDNLWLGDAEFENKIKGANGFEDANGIIVIEFYADFNKANCFKEWAQLDAPYYRVDVAFTPIAAKKYRVRMAPTIILFKDGSKEKVFKAGLDLLLPTNLKEINEAIADLKKSAAFE